MVQIKTPVKLMFFSWDNFYSKKIQALTHSKWSHIGIAVEHDTYWTVYEAINKGLVKSDYTKEFINECISDGRVCIKQTKLTVDKFQYIINAEKYLGTPYDFLSILNILLFIITKKSLKIGGVKALFCSEFVARVLYESNPEINFENEYTKRFDLITPADIFASDFLEDYK